MKRRFISFFVGMLLGLSMAAQQLNINVVIRPPYSTNLADYIDQGNNVLISVTNMSGAAQQFKLIPSLEGNNGVMVRVKDEFQPSSPIVMAPGETRMFTFNQLKTYNGNIRQSDLVLQGISFSVFENAGVLPEGAYTLCVRALSYSSGALLSGSSGCTVMLLTAYDPPVILSPQQQAALMALNPQFFTFQWTPSGISGQTRYRLRLVDATALNLMNPNDAFNSPYVVTYFEQSNIPAGMLVYDMSKPPLLPGNTYVMQVTAYDPQGKLSFKNNGNSQAVVFTIQQAGGGLPGDGGEPGVDNPGFEFGDDPPVIPVDPDDVADCMNAGACQQAAPNCEGAQAPSPGSTVFVGKFKMLISNIQAGSGTGIVEVPFLNTKVEVAFQNLTVNNANQACGVSQVWVKSAAQNLIPDDFLKTAEGAFSDQNLNWPLISQHVQQYNKKVSLFNFNGPANTLPFVLNMGQAELTILGIVFTPAAAYANIAFASEIPLGNAGQQFSFGMRGVCIRPNGFGISDAGGQLNLSANLVKNIGNNAEFILEGGNNGSYVKFDCKGVKEIKLKGSVSFSRERLLPVDAQGNIVPSPARYSLAFNTTINNPNDWIAEAIASHPAFTSQQANGFTLGFGSAVFDFSRTKNPQAMVFPANHPMMADPLKNTWTGVVLNSPKITLPNYLKSSDNQRITADISNIVLDGEGLWLKLELNNLVQKPEDGSLGGWGFSIEKLSLDIRKSMLQGGSLNGKVNLPITEVGLGYDSSFEPGDGQNDLKVNFGISMQGQLDIDMFFAKAQLADNSSFGVTVQGNKVKPLATLNGSLTIGWEKGGQKKPGDDKNSVSSFSIPSVSFQGFNIFNNDKDVPQLSLQALQLSNPNAQGKLSGFPIKLKGNPSFQNYNPEVGFNMGLEFTLTKDNPNGISGATDFTIFAKYDQQKKRYAYDRTQLNCISLDIDVAVAELKGGICIYKNDQVYGDGFSGAVDATIKGVGVQAAVALQVGNVNNYDYFYFEALAKSGQGFPITATMSLYGLGGGFHYNMNRTNRNVTTIDGYENVVPPQQFSPGYSPSGLLYTPQKGKKGFSATVVFGLTGGDAAASAFNGDLTFWMTLTGSNGIEKMGMNGGGYAMQPLNNREAASITGQFDITINFVAKTFDLGIDLNVGMGSMLNGTASVNMHASPEQWYIFIGSWEAPNPQNYEPWNDKKRNKLNADLKIAQIKYNLYFMMGSHMPDLPPMPGKVLANMQTQGGQMIEDQRTPPPPYNAQTPGFAFGAGFHQQLKFQALIFYADIEFFAGFDAVLKNYKAVPGCENMGINGWYAKGQAYAYLGIDAGLALDTWFYKGEWPVVKINCSATVEAQFTNPNYLKGQVYMNASVLNGLITVNKNVKFEAGEKMKCGSDVSPFGDLPIVSELFPGQGDEVEVYEDVRVAFNFPKGNFEVFNELEPDKAPRYFYYAIHSIGLRKGNTLIPLIDEPIYSKDGYSAKYLSKSGEFLPELSSLKLDFVVRGYEAKPGPDPMLVEEKYNRTFQTKKRPDHIPSGQLLATNPVVRQRYFLKEDEVQGFARTIGNKNWCYLFNKNELGDPKIFDQSKTKYLVQFFETGSGKTIEVPCTCSNQEIKFAVPYQQLKNETIYRVRVIARLEYRPKSNLNIQGNQLNPGNQWQTGVKQTEITQGAHKLSRFLLADNTPKTFDHSLLNTAWFFRTSKYNTLSDKLAEYKLDQSSYTTVVTSHYIPRIRVKTANAYGQGEHEYEIKTKPDGGGLPLVSYELPVALITGKEAFDMYDLFGYSVAYMGDSYPVKPLVGFHKPDAGNPPFFNPFYNLLEQRMNAHNAILPNKITFPANRHYDNLWLSEYAVNINIREISGMMGLKNGGADAIWSHSARYAMGIGNVQLPPGRTLWKPHGALTQKEIDDAMAATPQQQNMNANNMQLQILVPPNQNQGGMGGQVNQNIQNTNIPVYPLVNLSDYLAMLDYSHLISRLWTFNAPINRSRAFTAQEQLRPLLFRNKGAYTLQMGNMHSMKRFDYNWNREKPVIIF